MKTFTPATLLLLLFIGAQPLNASDFVVVAATGVAEPADLAVGQELAAKTQLKLESWGRALIRETGKCGMTHVLVGIEDYVLEPATDCAAAEDPRAVVGKIQQGHVFAHRIVEKDSQLAAQLVAALSQNPCVNLPRFSEEHVEGRQCPSGYAVRGFGCLGDYCDDKVLMCCPYLGGEPDPTTKGGQARWVSEEFPNVTTFKKYTHGMDCRGPYCDAIQPRTFKSSRIKATKACEWTPWVSNDPTGWVECSPGSFMSGVRCQGDYCADLAIYCCEAQVE
ncbi:MAG: hypothetical protein AAF560_19705 [Acidobacteriota bacterium]